MSEDQVEDKELLKDLMLPRKRINFLIKKYFDKSHLYRSRIQGDSKLPETLYARQFLMPF